jgi:fructose-1,6-bisphosphatase II
MHASTNGISDQNMSRPSCNSLGLAGLGPGTGSSPARASELGIGCGSSVTPRVSQFRPTDSFLGHF